MTAASGDPGETPPNGGVDPAFPAYGTPPDPAYGPPAYGAPIGEPAPGYPGSYPPPPPPPYGTLYQGNYGSPGGYPGYPGPGYPGYPGYPVMAQPGTNSLAITSLVFSIFGLLPFCGFLFSIVGIITGAVAMGQVKRNGQNGYGLAVAGLAIGLITLLLAIITFGLF